MAVQIKPEQAYAYSELLEVLSHMEEKYTNKIPKKLMNFFEENALSTYEKHIDIYKPLEEQNLSERTSALIAMLTLQYWCASKEEKKELINIFNENERKYQEELREKYNPDNIFNNKPEEVEHNTNNIDEKLVEIDELDRISNEENEKAKLRALKNEKIKEIRAAREKSGMLVDYNKFPWYKKAYTKVKEVLFKIYENIKKIKNPT